MSSSETAEDFNVVILHDRVTPVGPAKAAFLRLARELDGKLTPKLRIRSLELTNTPKLAARSADEIDSAEMVIMAANGSHFVRLCL